MVRRNINFKRIAEEGFMTKSDCERTEEEIDKLLNDPETPMHPDRIWALAEALAQGNCESADQVS
jgi:predicted ATPase